jgi:general nucleoside transport system permease protein
MADFLVNWISSIPGLALPYALASIGLIIGERAGVLSLGAEGLMLVGALVGVGTVLRINDPTLGLLAAMLASSMVSVLFACLVVFLRVNQVIAGLSLVFFCQGLTNLVGTMLDWSNRTIPGLGLLPLGSLGALPVIGPIFFRHDALVYLLVPIILFVQWLLTRTTFGLRLRAVGENPDAADSVGINVSLYRFFAVVGGSALIGLAGAYLSVVSAKIWVAGITGGRGWIAVALVIFARWNPWRALLGALLFGGIEALIPQIAAAGIGLPQYYLLMTPYLATLAVMVWQGLKNDTVSDEPEGLGKPFVREERR